MPRLLRRLFSRVALTGLLRALTAPSGLAQRQAASRRDADRLQQKIDLIAERGLVPRKVPAPTTVTETEINSYLAIYGKTQLPAGVVDPQLAILGSNRVSGRATIDLQQ